MTDDHGEDRGEEFDGIHTKSAKEQAKAYLIGKLQQSESDLNDKVNKDNDKKCSQHRLNR